VSEPVAPLLVFADDWGRHPSSCQHLVRRLAADRQVVWVNTIGTRPPRFDVATIRRGWEKVRQWLRPAAGGPLKTKCSQDQSVGVLNPRMWPWMSSRFDRALNRRLLTRQIAPAIAELPEVPVAVTTLPIVADLVGGLPVARWVYYCVDDFSVWPGLDGAALRRLEDRLVKQVDTFVAVSEPLRDRLAGLTDRPVHLLTHGVDVDFWTEGPTESLTALDGLERPLVVFWGVVDRRMDVEFVRQLAGDLDRGTIVLAGPHDQPDPDLLALPRVVCLGALPPEQLPQLAREAAVLVMPYADLPVTRAMQPLKLKEYLATGRPVVVRDLPATRSWADCLEMVSTPADFSAAVRQRIAIGLPASQQSARARLADEAWAAKAEAFERWIDGAPARPALELAAR
jgi:glycosyltransferase involved in cell wall biosynthesis